MLVGHFGRERLVGDIHVEDFDAFRLVLSAGGSLHSIGAQVTLCMIIFSFGYDNELSSMPVRFGQNFKRPSRKRMRIERDAKQNEHGMKSVSCGQKSMNDDVSVRVVPYLRTIERSFLPVALSPAHFCRENSA